MGRDVVDLYDLEKNWSGFQNEKQVLPGVHIVSGSSRDPFSDDGCLWIHIWDQALDQHEALDVATAKSTMRCAPISDWWPGSWDGDGQGSRNTMQMTDLNSKINNKNSLQDQQKGNDQPTGWGIASGYARILLKHVPGTGTWTVGSYGASVWSA